MIGGWRRRVERIEGLTLDALLIAAAVAVSEDAVQEWLLGHPPALYHGLALLHAVACPALLLAVFSGHGRAREALERPGTGLLIWAVVLLFAAGFIIPGVLGLLFRPPPWEFLATIFAPLVVLPLWAWAVLVATASRRSAATARTPHAADAMTSSAQTAACDRAATTTRTADQGSGARRSRRS